MIETLLKELRKKYGCVCFPPSLDMHIEDTNSFLSNHGFCELPTEYIKFLHISNGFSFDGVELYGTQSFFREEKNYTFPDLINTNKPYDNLLFFSNKVIIGKISEAIMFFDNTEKRYILADRINLRSRIEVDSFEELFSTYFS